MKRYEIRKLGGPGSGNYGHKGRPGQRGGSAPGGGKGIAWEKNMFGHFIAQVGDKNVGIRPPSKAQYREGYELRLGKGAGRGDEWVKLDHISREYDSLEVAQKVAEQFFQSDEGFVHHQTALNMIRDATLPEQKKM